MNDYTFGNFLYNLRTEKGLSQAQLGEMLGVTNKSVSKWENGITKPKTALIPKMAEIFGVTVEELFACRRFEKDCEHEKIKEYLASQKKKYAILSSVFLSITLTLPLLFIEFICVVMGFKLQDEIVGPIGSVVFIFAFISSITASIIYYINFRQSITPSKITYTPQFVNRIKTVILVSATVWLCGFLLLPVTYFLISHFSKSQISANIFLSIAAFVLIVLFGVLLCFGRIRLLLKIKHFDQTQKEKKKLKFSELPIFGKICYITLFILFPIFFTSWFFSLFDDKWIPAKLVSMFISLASMVALFYYNVKKK